MKNTEHERKVPSAWLVYPALSALTFLTIYLVIDRFRRKWKLILEIYEESGPGPVIAIASAGLIVMAVALIYLEVQARQQKQIDEERRIERERHLANQEDRKTTGPVSEGMPGTEWWM